MVHKSLIAAAALAGVIGCAWPVMSSAQVAASSAQQIFFDAFELLRQGESEKAEAKFREGLALDPDNARARLLLGDALRGRKDFAGARAAYEEAARKGAPDIAQEARRRLSQLPAPAAQQAATQKDPDKARASLQKAVALVKQPAKSPRDTAMVLALAEALTALGDRAQALEVLKVAVNDAVRPPDTGLSSASFGGSGERDLTESLSRAARDQWKAGDAAAAGRTLTTAERIARGIRGSNTADSKAAALTYVALGYTAVGDTANGNRVYNEALETANRADEGSQSSVRAQIAIARFRSGDVKGAFSLEDLVKQRHARFFVGHAWPDVMNAMAIAEAEAGRYDNVVPLISRGADDTGISSSSAYLDIVKIAIEKERFQAAEDLIPRITSDDKRFDALNAMALAYAARQRKTDVQRMLTRLREFGEGAPEYEPKRVERDHIQETLPAVLLYMGLREEAEKRAAAAKGKSEALGALARGFALTGDHETALRLLTGIPKDEDYRRNDVLKSMAQDCAIADVACALKVMQSPQFPDYVYSDVLKSRAKAGDWESALKLGAGLESLKPLPPDADPGENLVYYAMREAAAEVAKLGYCEPALKYTKYTEKDFVFWTLVGRCQAGLPVVTLEDSR